MNGFSSDFARLDWLLWEIHRLTPSLQGSVSERHDHHVLMVALGLVGTASSWASAINVLLHEEHLASVGPLQRALYELWVEFRYLLRIGSPSENAQLFVISAAFEVATFARDNRAEFSRESRRSLVRALRAHKEAAPGLYQRIVEQRRRRRFHWSGLSRTKLEQIIAPGSLVYKGLSWEAHAVMGPIRDLEVSDVGGGRARLEFKPRVMWGKEDAQWVAYMTGGILYYIWNDFAAAFGLPRIELNSA